MLRPEDHDLEGVSLALPGAEVGARAFVDSNTVLLDLDDTVTSGDGRVKSLALAIDKGTAGFAHRPGPHPLIERRLLVDNDVATVGREKEPDQSLQGSGLVDRG